MSLTQLTGARNITELSISCTLREWIIISRLREWEINAAFTFMNKKKTKLRQ